MVDAYTADSMCLSQVVVAFDVQAVYYDSEKPRIRSQNLSVCIVPA